MAVGVQQQQRRATEANWVTSGKVLAVGEIGYATDSHVIKIGDGVNTWDNLDIPYDGRYLPIGGKAADSEMVDGVSIGGLLLVGDAATAATADKLAKRDGSGRMKAATGVADDDVVNVLQMVTADTVAKQVLISRTVTAAFTLAATDVGKLINVANSSSTYVSFACNIPANASVPIAVGSAISLITTDKGGITLTPAGGVTLTGGTALPGGMSRLTLVKTGTDTWLVTHVQYGPAPMLYRRAKYGSDNTLTIGGFTKIRWDGADDAGYPLTNNYDTLGTNAQYNAATDVYKLYCRRAGYYDTDIQLTVEQNASGRIYIQTKINGVLQKFGAGGARINGPHMTHAVNGHLPLNNGDYVEVELYVEGGGSPTWTADEPYAMSFFNWAWQRPL